MDHTQAVTSMAAEKYLLDELESAVREEFEKHFFICQECAEDIRIGSRFLECMKEVFAQ